MTPHRGPRRRKTDRADDVLEEVVRQHTIASWINSSRYTLGAMVFCFFAILGVMVMVITTTNRRAHETRQVACAIADRLYLGEPLPAKVKMLCRPFLPSGES